MPISHSTVRFCWSLMLALATVMSAAPARAQTELERLPGGAQLHAVTLLAGRYSVRPVLNDRLRTTSQVARAMGAEVAINGGFFNHQDGVSASYLTLDGIERSDPHRNALLVGNPRLQPYLDKIFDRTELRILQGADGERWSMAPHFSPTLKGRLLHALQAGPRLLPDLRLEEEGFVAFRNEPATGRRRLVRDGIGAYRRAARSAIGLKPDGSLVLVVVVGPEGTGLTLPELRERLMGLGCQEAMALDGGSSTSLAVRVGKRAYKTIAPPEGEARVRSVLVVLPLR